VPEPAVPFLDLKPAYAELKEPIDAALHRVLDRNWYLLGEELEAFERDYAAYTRAPHAVGVANGLEALVLALQAVGIKPGDEVLVPAFTFIATWLAVSELGATPVPVDVLPGTCNLDPGKLKAALTPRCKAIVPVHLFGQAADLDPILAFAQAHGLKVVEDAAQAHGAEYKGRRIGCHGDAVAWSFYPGKNLGAYADGGAVTTASAEIAERLRLLRNYGSKVKYHYEMKGRNARLSEMQAAVLAVKLGRLDAWNARRAQLAERYLKELSGLKDLQLPVVEAWAKPVWHLFVVQSPRRDALQAHLASRGVQALIHYPELPQQSGAYAADQAWPPMPVSAAIAANCLSLPIGPHLSPEQADRVIDAVRSFKA
jgi:dTDP-4-amino-4,6-dideoxygalactose transaminase